MKATLDKMLK